MKKHLEINITIIMLVSLCVGTLIFSISSYYSYKDFSEITKSLAPLSDKIVSKTLENVKVLEETGKLDYQVISSEHQTAIALHEMLLNISSSAKMSFIILSIISGLSLVLLCILAVRILPVFKRKL